MGRLLPSLKELDVRSETKREKAIFAASALARELEAHKSEFDEHEFQLVHEIGSVEVRRGPLSIARIVFNYGDTGEAVVSSEVLGGPGFDGQAERIASYESAAREFKEYLGEATTLFYRRLDEFRALGLV